MILFYSKYLYIHEHMLHVKSLKGIYIFML